ncbi:MAG: hypothetical protein LBE36_13800 [Flavobacteriaceae bacterium]|jgi:hypothetical protein|nr:hypothetical protein [Flavobacteriaceae bacterium]
MKIFTILLFSLSCTLSAQKIFPMDSLKLRDVEDFFADDYGNIYLYKNKDFSFTKYDSLGKQTAKVMMTLPFKVQNVQNLLNIFLFSENAQELKMLDTNLNEIQHIDFRQKFGFVKSVYAEDLQQIWILDESTKRLIQYNYRNNATINSYPFDIEYNSVKSILVFEGKLYLIAENRFEVYNFKGEKIFEKEVENPRKLYRENSEIFVAGNHKIYKFRFPESFETVFSRENSDFVDKNSSLYFELKQGKLYICF